jgi:hypothetical protein
MYGQVIFPAVLPVQQGPVASLEQNGVSHTLHKHCRVHDQGYCHVHVTWTMMNA